MRRGEGGKGLKKFGATFQGLSFCLRKIAKKLLSLGSLFNNSLDIFLLV